MSRVTIKQVSQYVKLRLLSVLLEACSLDQQHHITKEHERNRFSGLTPAILNQKLRGWVSEREGGWDVVGQEFKDRYCWSLRTRAAKYSGTGCTLHN